MEPWAVIVVVLLGGGVGVLIGNVIYRAVKDK